jgi:primosomal protein N' (replication factor Y)
LEKTGQLILQVGGRSGREAKAGKVIIQTQFADQPILRQLITEGYTSFMSTVLSDRRANQLPPFCFHCLIRAESPQKQIAMDFLEDIAREPWPDNSVELLGPVAPTMEKRKGKYRAQLLLSSQSRKLLHRAVAAKIVVAESSKLSKRVRWSVDVDPIDLF